MSTDPSNSNSNNNNNNKNNEIAINESEFEIDGELIAQGAEAKIYKTTYQGKPTIVKYRFPKKYRHKQLDLKLRRNRSKKEQKCIKKSGQAGIKVPKLFRYDKTNCAIHMEFIDLPTVKTAINKYYDDKTQTYDRVKCGKILKEVGKNVAILHKNNLVHGDLTTSNLLINEEEKDQVSIVVIDFGLSEGTAKFEDKAVDIYVLERAFLSTHPNSEFMINDILAEYKKWFKAGQAQVIKRLEAVRLRGRKRSMLG